MQAEPRDLQLIRDRFFSLPTLQAHSTGQEVRPEQVYYPIGHAEALDPDVALVVGNRGMGKSFWAAALAQEATRIAAGKAYSTIRPMALGRLNVTFAFADAEGGAGGVSKLELEAALQVAEPETIWRAVLLKRLHSPELRNIKRLTDQARWVSDNPDSQREAFQRADALLTETKFRALFLFDQLEQLADNWNTIGLLTEGMLRLALALKSYKAIRLKIFMRPDQAESRALFRFPDASKISGNRVKLRWRAIDLFGLLYDDLSHNQTSRDAFQRIALSFGIEPPVRGTSRLRISPRLAYDNATQHAIFDVIAGPYMGASEKRGRPYTWIPLHLADAKGEVSPRMFLLAIREAAHKMPPPGGTSIDNVGIEEGVRVASERRLSELQEDYPWVAEVLEPLRGLLVPCSRSEIIDRWDQANVENLISKRHAGAKIPAGFDIAAVFDSEGANLVYNNLFDNLNDIGVFESRPNARINVPDIFRVDAGIRRRGGVTPQQRNAF